MRRSIDSSAVGEQRPLLVVFGPTASGKTSVAVDLARQFPIEIISADSRQVLRGLDIGTAKPTSEEQSVCAFHLIDLIDPGERYTAYRFVDDVDRIADEILSRNKIPVVVGGTGLYVRSLLEGVVEIEENDPSIRDRLESEMEQLGAEAMHRRLAEIDPDEAARIHPNNRVRIIRALEIFELTGQPKSKLVRSGSYKVSKHRFALLGLAPQRELLYQRINDRVEQMIAAGLEVELDRAISRFGPDRLKKAAVIGYDELLAYRSEECTLAEAIELIKQNSRRYAKRQMTWIRNKMGGNLEIFENSDQLKAAAVRFLRGAA